MSLCTVQKLLNLIHYDIDSHTYINQLLFFRPWMHPGAGTGAGGGHHQQATAGSGQQTAGGGGTGDDEAPKDPGARVTHQSYTEKDFEGELNFLSIRFLCSFSPLTRVSSLSIYDKYNICVSDCQRVNVE